MEDELWDEHGFAILHPSGHGNQHGLTKSGDELEDDRCHDYSNSFEKSSELLQDWQSVLKRWGKYRNSVRQEKVKNLILKGVPSSCRSDLWRKMLDLPGLQASSSFSYENHVQKLRDKMVKLGVTEYNVQKAEQLLSNIKIEHNKKNKLDVQAIRQILLDVGRSYPTHRNFFVNNADGVEGRAMLFRILAVYTQFNPVINYCQGMSYLGGMLLMFLPEKEAFWALVALLERKKYLYGYYDCKLERVQSLAKVFQKVVERKLPKVAEHLDSLSVDPLLFLPKWILCVYTLLPCWDSVLTIWDLLFLEGSVVLFQVALALMSLSSAKLLNIDDVNKVIPILQKVPHEFCNRDSLVSSLKTVKFEVWEIECIQAVIREEAKKVKAEAKKSVSSSAYLRNKIKSSPPKNVLQRLGRVLMSRYTASVATSTPKKKGNLTSSDSETSFECPQSQRRTPFKSVTNASPIHASGLKRASNLKKLVGSSASLQMAFRQFQTPLSRHASPCRPLTRNSSASRCLNLLPSTLSPMELQSFSAKQRRSRHRTRSTHQCPGVASKSAWRSPSPLELRPIGLRRSRRFLTP